jgi:hypothetical protein
VELLEAIEGLGPTSLLRTSFVAYPLVNALHIAAIGALFTSVALMDLAVLGFVRSIPREKLIALLRPFALGGFAVAVLTGIALFSVQATAYAGNPAFLVKLGLIVLAMVNFGVFASLDRGAPSGASSPPLRLSAAASILLWSGALVAGRFIGFL